MPDDPMTETPEDKAAIEAMQAEQPIELVQPETQEQPEQERAAETPQPQMKAEPEPQKPVRLVPHQALHEERLRRQALEREIADLRKPKPAQDAEIDENENPIGALAALKAKLKAWEDRATEERTVVAESQEIVARMAPRVEAYAKEHPEYPDQVTFLRNSRATELQLLGHDPQSIARVVAQEEMALARHVLTHDLDPGDVMAQLATARGWQAKAETQKPAPAQKPEERIARLAKGQKAATSSSGGGGGGGAANDEMSIEDLLNLDGAAFDKAASTFVKAHKRAGA